MKTNLLTNNRSFSEEELMDLGFEYTCQNFSKYLIFKRKDEYFLMDEIQENQFKVQFNFADN